MVKVSEKSQCWKISLLNEVHDPGRFPFTKKFRKSRLGCKWNTTFRFVPLEIFRNKRNSWKGSPVFPVETSQWKICVPFTDFSSLSPVPCLSRSFKRQASLQLPRVSTKMAADQGQFSGSFLQTNFQGYYECSAYHVLTPDLENLLQHECAAYKSGK